MDDDATNDERPLTDVGEYQIHTVLESILNTTQNRAVGDDCAVIPVSEEQSLLVNVDRLANGVAPHMRARLCVAQTLSDIICMGGRPTSFLVALTLTRDTTIGAVRELTTSLRADVESYGARVVGGDTKEGPIFHMVGVGIGTVSPTGLVRRIGAEPGMLIGVTSAAGRPWGTRWAHAVIAAFRLDVSDDLATTCRDADYNLVLPFAETRAMHATRLLRAGLDLSDGIGGGLKILARSSGVGVRVDRSALRDLVNPALRPITDALGLPLECMALSPGYNWENMYAIRAADLDAVAAAAQSAGGAFTVIGEATEAPEILLDDREVDLAILPADEKFAHDYAWEDRFTAWRANLHALLANP